MDNLEGRPFSELPLELQKNVFWGFGIVEEHFKCRDSHAKAYKEGNFPIFDGYNHMQFQIRDPKGFAKMPKCIIETGKMPKPPFLK